MCFAVLVPAMAEEAPRSSSSIQALVAGHESDIQEIYTRYLVTDPKLEGKIMIWVALGSSGTVLQAGVSQNTTGDSNLGNELLEMVKSWSFGTGTNQTITFPITLTPPPPGAVFTGRKHRNATELAYAFETRKKTLNAYYDQRRIEKPNLQGDITLKVTVNEAGTVTGVEVIKDTPADEALTKRFLELVRECHLPAGPADSFEYQISFMPFGVWKGN